MYKHLKKHKELYRVLLREQKRQSETINLVASENYASPEVLEALGTVFTNKYAEGKAGHRYYFGTQIVDQVEELTEKLFLKLFKLSSRSWAVNVQPYSGSGANFAVYAALVKPGDTILAMGLDHGGHLTHGHAASFTSKVWNFVHYGVDRRGFIDYGQIQKLGRKHKPKLIVCGASSYARTIDFKKFARIAKSVDAYLMADISHIAGLVAAGVHPSPFPYAHVITTTTHKTLRGPRAAVIFAKKIDYKLKAISYKLNDLIDRSVFPGLQGGPHLNTIFAVAIALQEAFGPSFKRYAWHIVKNAQTLAKELARCGFPVITGGTDTHLFSIDVTPFGITGKQAGELLERAGIIVNKNMIPYDSRKPWDPSGIRLGTPAVTTRGMGVKEIKLIAQLIKRVLVDRASVGIIKKEVLRLTKKFPLPR